MMACLVVYPFGVDYTLVQKEMPAVVTTRMVMLCASWKPAISADHVVVLLFTGIEASSLRLTSKMLVLWGEVWYSLGAC